MNLPNILSLTRIALALIFAILLFNSYKIPAAGIFFLAMATDVLDGYLARKYNQVTTLGKILDPAADRLLALLALLILYLNHGLPPGLAIFAIFYHLYIVLGWVIIFQTKKIAIEHTFWGKLNSFVQVVMFFAVIFDFYPNVFFAAVTISLSISFLNYTFRAVKILKIETRNKT